MISFRIEKSRCVQCGECAADCPVSIIDMDEGWPRIPEHKESYCIRCQHCLAVCPTAAVSVLGKDPDLSQSVEMPEADAMERLCKGRRSVRRYRRDAVSARIVDRLLDVAGHAPTGKNERRLRFTLIDDPLAMDAVRARTYAGIRRAVAASALPSGMEFFAKLLEAYEQGRDVIFRDAPHMLLVSAPKDGASPEADPFIALGTFELMAQTLGVGTLWCGFARMAVRDVVPEMRLVLGIPEDYDCMYAMLFGYPAVRYARAVQRDTPDVHRVRLVETGGE